MALTSWFRLPNFSFASVVNAAPRRPSVRRQPLRSRLHLESLEDRMLLSAGTANQMGYLNNPSVNYNTQASGLTLPNNSQQNNPLGTVQYVNTLLAGQTGAQAAPLAESQVNDQFRAFGVNSQGQGNGFQGMQMVNQMAAMGFGSGVQPNAPWMPAAYNLGLANHQFNYSSQGDNGFQSVPPWFHSSMQEAPQAQPPDEELASKLPEDFFIYQSMDGEQTPQGWIDDTGDKNEKGKAPVEQSATDEAAPDLTRGDPAIEEALFTDPLHTLMATAQANRIAHAASQLPSAKHLLDSSANNTDGAREDGGIPSSLWLSTLAPAQVAALVTGLPAVAAPAVGGEAGSGSAD